MQVPTNRDETSSLLLQPIWSFNIRGFPGTDIAAYTRELLPHVFTMTTTNLAVVGATWFSVALSVAKHLGFAPTFSGGGLLCVARTFLREFYLTAIEKLAAKYTKMRTSGFSTVLKFMKVLGYV